MKTSLFDFELSESLIATRPANPRDSARLLIIPPPIVGRLGGGQSGHDLSTNAPLPASPLWGEEYTNSNIRDLPSFLKPGDVMVFNDTRVIPARIMGQRGTAKIEILLHKNMGDGVWQCFAKPAKKLKTGDRIDFADDFSAMVKDKLLDGQVVLMFDAMDLRAKLEHYGQMPLPPYIEKQRHADDTDKAQYQTIYAKHEGSVAAPTAGLHFTDNLFRAIDEAGVKRVQVTLHVGGGTFLPVKVEDTKDHVMHSEFATITPETAAAINAAKKSGGRVIAVGTTSLRTLESATDANGMIQPFNADTDIFITPGYRFKCVDMLLTNFHLPKSTLFMLVCAFAGTERMKSAYAHAISQHYRFYSYGDACLIYRHLK